MIKKVYIGIAMILHIIAFILLSKYYMNMDIIGLLGLCYIPMIISLLICALDTYVNSSNNSIVYSIINIIYLVIANVFIKNSNILNTIYENSKKYLSNNVNISLDSSPILSLIIFSIISLVLHILVTRLINRKKTKERFK